MTWKEAIKIDLETRKVSKELTKDRIEWCTFKVLCVWKLVTKYEEIKFLLSVQFNENKIFSGRIKVIKEQLIH